MTARKASVKCYLCGETAHTNATCRLKGNGLKLCYECNKISRHNASECEKQLERLDREQRAKQQRFNRQNRYAPYTNNYNNQASRNENNDNSYNNNNKRPHNDNDKTQENKNKRFKAAFNRAKSNTRKY